MVSRSTGPMRKIAPAVAAGLAALLVGCGAGQVTQTDSMEPAVNGNRATVGDIALRDVVVAFPDSGDYEAGDDAPLLLTIVNVGEGTDELLSVSSPAAEDVELTGDTNLPSRMSLQVLMPDEVTTSTPETTETSIPDESIETPSPPAETGEQSASPPPESDQEPTVTGTADPDAGSELENQIGTMSIVLTGLVQDLPIGRNVPVTFVFAKAGQITVNLPIASPTTARQDPPEAEEDSGH